MAIHFDEFSAEQAPCGQRTAGRVYNGEILSEAQQGAYFACGCEWHKSEKRFRFPQIIVSGRYCSGQEFRSEAYREE
jgi:hypothetical protein